MVLREKVHEAFILADGPVVFASPKIAFSKLKLFIGFNYDGGLSTDKAWGKSGCKKGK
jgi:hypothetical protein